MGKGPEVGRSLMRFEELKEDQCAGVSVVNKNIKPG